MQRREFLYILSALTLSPFALNACRSTNLPLRIGIHPWPGYEPLFLAENFGWLPENFVLDPGDNAGDSLSGLLNGTLDGACLTLDEVLMARSLGVPLVVVLVMNESVGADMVLTRPDIQHFGDLAGKRIAVEESAVGGLVLAKLLAAAQLERHDVEILNIPPDRHYHAWQQGHIDAAVTYEPIATHLRRLGGERLFDSRRFPGFIFDVLALRTDRLRRHTASIKNLITAHFRALDHLRLNREDAMRRIAYWRQLTYVEAETSFAGLSLPSTAANRRMLAPGGALEEAADSLSTIMYANDLLTDPVSLDGLTTSAYLPRSKI